jgi:abhydrolase domain-containing protein 12
MHLLAPFQSALRLFCVTVIGYFFALGLLTIPYFQHHAIYQHALTLTWSKDVSIAEQWGFLRNQVTPFTLNTSDDVTLHAWHVLPLELYRRHEAQLVKEPGGTAVDLEDRTAFKLLREDPEALLVLYFHGAAGTLGSGWRPPSYRAMSAFAPDKIHTVAIDYRGYGSSTGTPSEQGLLRDAITVAEWAMWEANIPPSRIVIFGQSLGTAVSIALAHHFALQPNPILFSGMVLVAPFADVELLTATYRFAGWVPILGPLAPFPRLLAFLNTFVLSKWPSNHKLAAFVRACENMPSDDRKYYITIIHAEDDYDVPFTHSDQLFWHAVNASRPDGITSHELEKEKERTKTVLGPAGWTAEHRTQKGVIREEILKWGLHDRIMSYPIVSLAVLRAFGTPDAPVLSVADD